MDKIIGRVCKASNADFPFYALIIIGGKAYERGVDTDSAGFNLIQEMFASITADAKATGFSDQAKMA